MVTADTGHEEKTLAEIPPGVPVMITRLLGGGEFRKKMTDLGLLPGKTVVVVRGNKGFPVVVAILGTQVMLGRGMAKKVAVAPVENDGA